MADAVESLRHLDYPVSHFLGAVHNQLWLFLRDVHPLRTREEAEDYIARLRQVMSAVEVITLDRGEYPCRAGRIRTTGLSALTSREAAVTADKNYDPERAKTLGEFVKAGGSAKCLTLRLDGEDAAIWP